MTGRFNGCRYVKWFPSHPPKKIAILGIDWVTSKRFSCIMVLFLRFLLMRGKSEMVAEEGWVSVAEVAAHLRVTKDSIYRWVDARDFPAHRVGRLLRFQLSEVDEWVRTNGGTARDTH